MPSITPFLWFDSNAEAAADFYVSIFPNSRRLDKLASAVETSVPKGKVITVRFELDGQQFTALNGGPGHPFNDAVSFVVPCKDQAELDRYWDALLADGGEAIQCGWLKDKFGLRWQIVPENIMRLIDTPAGMRAMMQMKKFDIAALEAAANSDRSATATANG